MTADVAAVLARRPKPSLTVGPITRTDIVRYAGAARDFNPLHHDEIYAQEMGHPSVFAHGMLSAGILASFVTAWFGADSMRHFGARFREIVWPGDRLSAGGEITAVEQDGEGLLVTLDLELTRNDGTAVVTGKAQVRVDRDA